MRKNCDDEKKTQNEKIKLIFSVPGFRLLSLVIFNGPYIVSHNTDICSCVCVCFNFWENSLHNAQNRRPSMVLLLKTILMVIFDYMFSCDSCVCLQNNAQRKSHALLIKISILFFSFSFSPSVLVFYRF